jgi:hypothetical protein
MGGAACLVCCHFLLLRQAMGMASPRSIQVEGAPLPPPLLPPVLEGIAVVAVRILRLAGVEDVESLKGFEAPSFFEVVGQCGEVGIILGGLAFENAFDAQDFCLGGDCQAACGQGYGCGFKWFLPDELAYACFDAVAGAADEDVFLCVRSSPSFMRP